MFNKYLKYKHKYIKLKKQIAGSNKNGDKYSGDLLNDLKHGKGTMIYENDDVYEGDWDDDKKSGNGTMTYANGDVYEGDWDDDQKVGDGTMTYANGDVYNGEWANDQKCGDGTMTYANYDLYIGGWYEDIKYGNGTMAYANGDIYTCFWDEFTNTIPIIQAAQTNNIALIEKLISEGEDINVKDKTGKNAYFYACENNFTNIAKVLINAGADINNTNQLGQKCFISIDEKPEEIKSVGVQQQIGNICFAHCVARNFIRTLQVFGIIKSKYTKKFYDLFCIVIIQKFGCKATPGYDTMIYLLHYLRDNLLDYIRENEEFIQWIDDDKDIFITKFNSIKNLLHIKCIIYITNEGKNNPTPEIFDMLSYKLQPAVVFTYSNNLYSDKWLKKSNLKPLILKLNPEDEKCIISEYNHGVNLREWTDDYVEFKNSWGVDKYNSGNFSVSDIRQLSCITENMRQTTIVFFCLMPELTNLPPEINFKIIQLYKKTINIQELKLHNSKIIKYYIDSQGNIYNGSIIRNYQNNIYEKHGNGKMTYANGNVYDGQWLKDKKDGKGTMTYANGDIYDGQWLNDKKEGKGTMTYIDGNIYDGQWSNDNITTELENKV